MYAVVQTCDKDLKAYFHRINYNSVFYMCWLFCIIYILNYIVYMPNTREANQLQLEFFCCCCSWSPTILIPRVTLPLFFFHAFFFMLPYTYLKLVVVSVFLDQCEKQAATVQTQVSGGKENASPTSAGENSPEKSKFLPPMPLHVYISFCFVLTGIYFNLTAEQSQLIQEKISLVLNTYQFSGFNKEQNCIQKTDR